MHRTVLNVVMGLGLCLGVLTNAGAANSGWYLGFNMGHAEVEAINESDLGYKFYGGFLRRNFGAELGLIGLGDGYTADNVDIYGMSFEFIGRVPVSDAFSLLGKFGLFWWTVENCYSGYYYYYCVNGTYDDGSDLTYGVGLQYDMNYRLSIRAEWQQFEDVGASDVSLLSAGILYTF